MARLVLLFPLSLVLACGGKDENDTPRDSGTDSDSGTVDSGSNDTGSNDTGDCAPAAETCNGVDDDCDGEVDEADATDVTAYYADADGDGFGDPSRTVNACAAPANHVTDNQDCDDTSALAHPGREEIPEDGLDNDCDPASIVPTMLYAAFSPDSATNGNWTLGYTRYADPATFTAMTSYRETPYSGVDAWLHPSIDSLTVYRNYTSSVIRYVQAYFPGNTLILHPGVGHAAAMRWTAPAATDCQVEVIFYGCDTTSTTAQAYASGAVFADGAINGSAESVSGAITQRFEAGQTIDLIVDANGDKDWDSTCVDGYLMCR